MDSITKRFYVTHQQAWRLFAALLMGLLIMLPTSVVLAASSGTWTLTGSMSLRHYNHTATLLQNGQVLVAGGDDQTSGGSTPITDAELYNPAAGSWSTTGSLNVAREQHAAALLQNGQVLVAGGTPDGVGSLASAELYNPATGKWTLTGSMNNSRQMFTATLLENGQVLVAGGNGTANTQHGYTASAELYNPVTGKWTLTGSMLVARDAASAVLLGNGQVLMAGGVNFTNGFLAEVELYNPASGTWATTGSMHSPREMFTATLLSNGQVLASGGQNSGTSISAQAEVYMP